MQFEVPSYVAGFRQNRIVYAHTTSAARPHHTSTLSRVCSPPQRLHTPRARGARRNRGCAPFAIRVHAAHGWQARCQWQRVYCQGRPPRLWACLLRSWSSAPPPFSCTPTPAIARVVAGCGPKASPKAAESAEETAAEAAEAAARAACGGGGGAAPHASYLAHRAARIGASGQPSSDEMSTSCPAAALVVSR